MARYTNWYAFKKSAVTESRPDLVDVGRKLLGYLELQRRLSGIKTCKLERTLPDGSIVRAQFSGDQPMLTIIPAAPNNEALLQPLLLQGFTIRPDGAAPADLEDIILVPGTNINDLGERSWLSLFADITHIPDPAPSRVGTYDKNAQNKPVFSDGMSVNGNLDWRNLDETMVVTFFGPEDRYFKQSGGSSYHTVVMINGGVVLDYADHPLYNSPSDVVIGACVRETDTDTLLVWCIAGLNVDTGDPYIRFYTAPLARSAESLWATVPLKYSPRFARIAAADMTLLYEEQTTYNASLSLFGLFAFNQSATEGRKIHWDNADTIEMIFDFSNLEHPSLTTQVVGSDLVGLVGSNGTCVQTVVANAYVAGTRSLDGGDPDSDDDTGYFWGYAVRPFRVKEFSYTLDADLEVIEGICAVDYKDDVPVYANTRRRFSLLTDAMSFTSSPTVTPFIPATYGSGFDATNATVGSHSITSRNDGVHLPWGKVLEGTSTFDYTGSGEAASHFLYNSAGGLIEAEIDNSSVGHSESTNTYMVPFYCDMRNDTVIYAMVTSEVSTDYLWTSGVSGAYPNFKNARRLQTTQHIVRTIQLYLHINGEDVVVGDPQVCYDETLLTDETELVDLSIGNFANSIRRGQDTNVMPFVGVGSKLDAARPIVEDGEAYSQVAGATNTAMVAALDAMAGPKTVGPTIPDVSGILDTTPTQPTASTTSSDRNIQPGWAEQRGTGDAQPPIAPIGTTYLYGPPGAYTPPMPWGVQSITYRIPLATEGTYSTFTHNSYGGWQVLRDAYMVSMPWPLAAAQRFTSVLAQGEFGEVTGIEANAANWPVSLTAKFLYGQK